MFADEGMSAYYNKDLLYFADEGMSAYYNTDLLYVC